MGDLCFFVVLDILLFLTVIVLVVCRWVFCLWALCPDNILDRLYFVIWYSGH